MREIIIEVPDGFGKTLKPEKVNSEIKGELVRCKNCVWFDGFCCQNINNKRMTGMEIDDFEWFCANGERRD